MKKILLSQLLVLIISCAVFESVSYGSGKFKEYYNQAIEYYKQGKYDQAGKQFEKALELKPNDAYALYGLGNTYYCKAKYDEAIKIYTKAISINPDYAKVHYSLSLAYNKMGMTREAEKEKKIFRKISQGEKGGKTSSAHEKSSRAPVQAGEHTSSTKHERQAFGLASDKHADEEHSDFGRGTSEHGHTQEHDKVADHGGEHDQSAEQKHVEKDAHTFGTFGSRRNHVKTERQGHSTESTHVAQETHAFSSKRSHDEADKHGHATEDAHVAAQKHEVSSKRDHAAVETHGGTEHADSHGTEAEHAFGKKHADAGSRHTEPAEHSFVERHGTSDKHVTTTHGTKKHLKEADTHTIFQGYTKESSKPKSHLFVKKQGKSYGYDMSPVLYVKSEWTKSRIHKIFICAIGYVFVTQMWLSVIAFFGYIVWRIRKKNIHN